MPHEAAVLVRSELDHYLELGTELARHPDLISMELDTQMEALRTMEARLDFLVMGVIYPDGTAYYPDGNTADLADREYFNNAMRGTANFSNVLISRVTDSAVMIPAVPITDNSDDTVAVAEPTPMMLLATNAPINAPSLFTKRSKLYTR